MRIFYSIERWYACFCFGTCYDFLWYLLWKNYVFMINMLENTAGFRCDFWWDTCNFMWYKLYLKSESEVLCQSCYMLEIRGISKCLQKWMYSHRLWQILVTFILFGRLKHDWFRQNFYFHLCCKISCW